jgi:hypothetical protein
MRHTAQGQPSALPGLLKLHTAVCISRPRLRPRECEHKRSIWESTRYILGGARAFKVQEEKFNCAPLWGNIVCREFCICAHAGDKKLKRTGNRPTRLDATHPIAHQWDFLCPWRGWKNARRRRRQRRQATSIMLIMGFKLTCVGASKTN